MLVSDSPPDAAPLDPRAGALVEALALRPHPEGGYYQEAIRSQRRVRALEAGAPERAALTSIYFLLVAGTHSRWHRVEADEVWHHYEGAPLELLQIDAAMQTLTISRVGPVDGGGTRPLAVVPAGCWQAARPTGSYTLVGCTVGPGFDFADFALLEDRPEEAAVLRARFPEVRALG
jgi:hypothetical protein